MKWIEIKEQIANFDEIQLQEEAYIKNQKTQQNFEIQHIVQWGVAGALPNITLPIMGPYFILGEEWT